MLLVTENGWQREKIALEDLIPKTKRSEYSQKMELEIRRVILERYQCAGEFFHTNGSVGGLPTTYQEPRERAQR